MKNKIKITQAEVDALNRKYQDQSTRIDALKNLASRTAFELDDMKDRVERSKPVFERMIGKVRKRNEKYRAQAEVLASRADQSTTLAKQYMKLHEMGIAIIEKHGLLGKFTQPNTNFTDREPPRTIIPPDIREFVTGPGRARPKPPVPEHHRTKISTQRDEQDEEDLVQMRSPDPIKPQSLFEQLQKKLKMETKPPLPISRPAQSPLLQKIGQVSQQLKREASKLRQMRKSLYRGPNSTSETRIRPAQPVRSNYEEPPAPLPKSASLRFIQSKQKRLDSLRDKTAPSHKPPRS